MGSLPPAPPGGEPLGGGRLLPGAGGAIALASLPGPSESASRGRLGVAGAAVGAPAVPEGALEGVVGACAPSRGPTRGVSHWEPRTGVLPSQSKRDGVRNSAGVGGAVVTEGVTGVEVVRDGVGGSLVERGRAGLAGVMTEVREGVADMGLLIAGVGGSGGFLFNASKQAIENENENGQRYKPPVN